MTAYRGRLRWGLAVVSAKVGLAVRATLAAIYPVLLVVVLTDSVVRSLHAFAGESIVDALRAGAAPCIIVSMHALWSFSGREPVAEVWNRGLDAIAPPVFDHHRE